VLKRFIVWGTGLILFVALALLIAWSQLVGYMAQPLTISSSLIIQVDKGATLSRVAAALQRAGVLDNTQWFKLYARLQDAGRSIKAGEYLLTPEHSLASVLDMMVKGLVLQHQLTLLEGKTVKDYMALMADGESLKLQRAPDSELELTTRLGIHSASAEGWFFPDTYRYIAGDSDLDILGRAYERMKQVLDEEWAGRAQDLPLKSPYEALILASIIEKETGAADERADIAGVFIRRLQKGMRLQTDPTVIYGLRDRYDGNLTRKDLRRRTPFNTYLIKGLPPTPIASPGREAIHAALHPGKGNAVYFVAKGNGYHQFSETLAQHNRAVQRYQMRRRRNDYRSSPDQQ
jgi:UPF0755 protein